MRRIISILTVILLLGASLASGHTYTESSVLASGSFVKIRVAESGMYRLTYSELKSMGLNPASVRIYGYGGAMESQNFQLTHPDDLPLVPVYADKGADGVFGEGDCLWFYGQGPVKWTYNGSRFVHSGNTYSDYGYYFLTSDHGALAEVETTAAPSGTASTTVTTYTALLLHEKDSINLVDRTGVEGGGREWYGEQFTPGCTRSFAFTLNNPTGSANSMRCYISLAAYSSATSSFTANIAGTQASVSVAYIPSTDFYTKANTAIINRQLTPAAGSTQTVTLSYACSAATALGNLDYIELSAECQLAMVAGKPLFFRTAAGYKASTLLEYQLSGASSETVILDITDLSNITRVNTTLSADVLSFKASNNTIHEYVAFNPSSCSALSPTTIGTIANQNLHALQDVDMVIITPEDFRTQAQLLADAHTQYDNMICAVVSDQQVYNEFSSGTPDATAYRWLMKMLYDRANASGGTIRQPGYLLLFGDGSFDNRHRLLTSGNNWLLTYQAKNSVNEVKAYGTDDYFAFLDDNEGEYDINGRMDISVGRLPVNSTSEAETVVSKLITYMQNDQKGRWKLQSVFLADDGDHNLHTTCADVAGEDVRIQNPNFIVNKVYLDAYTQEVNASGESYPLAETRLNNLLSEGVLLFDYCGHSGYNNASSEGLVSIATIRKMQCPNPAFWMFASCSFALFDAGKTSAAEEAVLSAEGGALAVCSSDRTVYASQNTVLNRHICDSLFAHSSAFDYHNRIGDAVRLGKNATGSDENKMAYVLLGDPATSLHFPTDDEVITTSMSDTLNALSVNTVQGYLRSADGDTASWFNGKLFVTVFDKMQQVTTLDNDETEESAKVKYTYNDYPNILFQGETTVTNGRFTFDFMVPRDVRYNYGTGRIVYYAYDPTTGEEANGHYEQFIVGGSSSVAIIDTIGPDLTIYINTPSFADGDQTAETPHFFAEIEDEHGINTVGSGIGHDLLLIVDNKPSETYVLNDYFSATNGSYQRGTVSYRMAEMEDGIHTAFFRAWDLMNNSSSRTVSFEVVHGLDPSVISVMSYPNPITSDGTLSIEVDYDQPDVVMQTDVFIYDLAGRLVHQITQRGTENLTWNLGGATPTGVYLYKVQLSSSSTKTISKTGKLIITK